MSTSRKEMQPKVDAAVSAVVQTLGDIPTVEDRSRVVRCLLRCAIREVQAACPDAPVDGIYTALVHSLRDAVQGAIRDGELSETPPTNPALN